MRALLALEDGTWFEGRSFTGPGESGGEVIFNTGMSGYQEILTDPSYRQQLVCMTYPHMGNYGVNLEDIESSRVQVAGFIVKECCRQPSNWRSTASLADYLMEHKVMGLERIDTRALTRHIRIQGAMRAFMTTEETDPQRVVARACELPPMEGLNLVQAVTPQAPYLWTESGPQPVDPKAASGLWPGTGPRVAAIDCGMKWNILRLLSEQGLQAVGVPASFSADQVRSLAPDAIFVSNGPGDPAAVPESVQTTADLCQNLPVGGICLGHQILGLALGGTSFKLKFGHHGINHPVKNLADGRIEISSQNHGFCVNIDAVESLIATHINLNDQTLEGFRHRDKPIMALQYHPEAAPGPHDSRYFFKQFADMVRRR